MECVECDAAVVDGEEGGAKEGEGGGEGGGEGAKKRRKKDRGRKKADLNRPVFLGDGKKPAVRRGDLDNMRLRKDELRKQLDAHFVQLTKRIGRMRQEPIGLDRDGREYAEIMGHLVSRRG